MKARFTRHVASTALGCLTVAVLAAAPAPAAAGDDQAPSKGLRLRVSLEPAALPLGAVGHVHVEVSGPGMRAPAVAPRFELDNLEIVGGASQSQQFAVDGNGARWLRTWSWPVRGLATGPAQIRAISLGGTDPPLGAEPVTIEIVAAPPPGSRPRSPTLDEVEKLLGRPFPDPNLDRRPPPPAEPRILLRTLIDEERPFVGQRVRLTTWIYTQARVQNLERLESPDFAGLWAETAEVRPVEEQESVEWQGEVWRRAPIERRLLYPLKDGKIRIGSTRIRVLSQHLERDRLFFRPIVVPVELIVESEPLMLDVRPLPPLPPELAVPFSGAVGRMKLAAKLVPSRLEAGRGASLTVTASGPGVLDGLTPPQLAEMPGIAVSSAPASQPEAELHGRSWSFVLVPEASGRQALPPVEMAYFDPDLERYEVARAELPVLDVRPAAVTTTDRTASAPRDAPVKPTSGLTHLLPLALGGPAVIGLALFALYRRRSGPAARTGGLALPPEATAEFAAALERARTEDRPRRAAREIEDAWRALLANVPGADGVPLGAPSPADWPGELARHGVPVPLVEQLESLVVELVYLRHAPELATTSALVDGMAGRSLALARALG